MRALCGRPEGDGERATPAETPLSAESNAEGDPKTLRSQPGLKLSQMLNQLEPPRYPNSLYFKMNLSALIHYL